MPAFAVPEMAQTASASLCATVPHFGFSAAAPDRRQLVSPTHVGLPPSAL